MKHILCFGDSNTWGFDISTYDFATQAVKRMPFAVRWPGAMQQLLGEEYRVIEEALNGRTCILEDPYMPHRPGLPALQTALESHAPLDLVLIQLGANELKHMFQVSAGMIASGFETLIQTILTGYYGYPVPQVLIIAPAPVKTGIETALFGYNFGPLAAAKSREFGELYRQIAERYHCGFLDCAALGFELNNIDCLHYSKNDHAKLAAAAAVQVKEMLA